MYNGDVYRTMKIDTGAFGLGGTTKTIPELVEQIGHASEYVDLAIDDFLEARMNRDKDKSYYGEEGLGYLKKLVEYQNRINNRIGKLWIVYNKEVKNYHRDRHQSINERYPDAETLEPIKHHDTTKIIQGYTYEADEDFKAQASNEIDLVRGKRYLISGEVNDSGLTEVTDMETGIQNYAPSDHFDLASGEKHVERIDRETGKYYMAEKDYIPEQDGDIELIKDHYYYLLDVHDNGWALIEDPDTNQTGHARIDYLSTEPWDDDDSINSDDEFRI